MTWAGYIVCMGKQKIDVDRRCTRETWCEDVNWIELVQNMVQFGHDMNLWVPKIREFLDRLNILSTTVLKENCTIEFYCIISKMWTMKINIRNCPICDKLFS
jgi:hypothetical protein